MAYNDTVVSWSLEHRYKLLVVALLSYIKAKHNTTLKSLGIGSLVLGSLGPVYLVSLFLWSRQRSDIKSKHGR